MTTTEMLAYVEAQIRKDIPRLMELREGLLVQEKYTDDEEICKIIDIQGDRFVIYNSEDYFLTTEIEETLTDEYEIIGHDIMINDVLEWLSKIDKPYRACFIDELGFISRLNFDMTMEVNGVKWNLQSPYLNINQPKELIEFLYELIKE